MQVHSKQLTNHKMKNHFFNITRSSKGKASQVCHICTKRARPCWWTLMILRAEMFHWYLISRSKCLSVPIKIVVIFCPNLYIVPAIRICLMFMSSITNKLNKRFWMEKIGADMLKVLLKVFIWKKIKYWMRTKKMGMFSKMKKMIWNMKTLYKVLLNLWNMMKMMIDSKCWKCSKK